MRQASRFAGPDRHRTGHAAAFPLGFGLSYTDFTVDDLVVTTQLPRPWPATLPALGARLRFNVAEATVHRLGPGRGGSS